MACIRWHQQHLLIFAEAWFQLKCNKKANASIYSYWWPFAFAWNNAKANIIVSFVAGTLKFAPIKRIHFKIIPSTFGNIKIL